MLARETIISALTQLSTELSKQSVIGEINLVGGTAMVLAFNARLSTKDVDAIFEPSEAVRSAASRVAVQLDLPADWLNDAAKGFLSPAGDFEPTAVLDLPNLRVLAPTPEYMLAMKVLASRVAISPGHGDAKDIAFLIRRLDLKSSDEVLTIVSRYYDPSQILPRSLYLLDEILEEINSK